MGSVTIHKAKTELSKLIARVEAGEEIVIMRRETPVARLVNVESLALPKRKFGQHPEFGIITDDLLFAPMTEDELALWDGGK